jgi:menaquinol-cytochrome c reductase iron-sulfur subunit
MNQPSHEALKKPERRSFFARVAAVLIGAIVTIFPFASGWAVVVHPLRRRDEGTTGDGDELADFVRICPLESVPADGIPHPFVVTDDVVDAWTRIPKQRVGEVFLARTDADGKSTVNALSATCPHLGCTVEWHGAEKEFECPCHESGFAPDGTKLFGPSLRGLDPLDVKVMGEDGAEEVWIRYEAFRAGIAERIPV